MWSIRTVRCHSGSDGNCKIACASFGDQENHRQKALYNRNEEYHYNAGRAALSAGPATIGSVKPGGQKLQRKSSWRRAIKVAIHGVAMGR
jgi:hypothetical protein